MLGLFHSIYRGNPRERQNFLPSKILLLHSSISLHNLDPNSFTHLFLQFKYTINSIP
ncbi:Protein of unknown function [Pyronema omphalodes CBS 100304]|uniref:Uncharacterized protein n=1 Tax=Pyronema omphalodes (strain CBS 100304) TaxID=1076935 RepID=U4LCC1_PYROM|nr:Protein of unknown function [Pyronema omphalodes CBS 100304]